MTQREKLIELLNEARRKCVGSQRCLDCVGYGKGAECINHLSADYCIANGVIVPPCKVGDVLYTTYDSDTEVERLNVNEILIKTCDGYVFFVINYRYYFSFDSFGKTVFLTREEAEKALAERSGK